jgi:hypothetical protein
MSPGSQSNRLPVPRRSGDRPEYEVHPNMASTEPIPRVFISYTAEDLAAHADVVAAVLRKLQMLAIDHRDSGATGQPSVSWCMEQVDSVNILVVLLAHRYGWVPARDDGGDGETCITWLEVKRARQSNKIVLPYLVAEGASWPTNMIEGLANPAERAREDKYARHPLPRKARRAAKAHPKEY